MRDCVNAGFFVSGFGVCACYGDINAMTEDSDLLHAYAETRSEAAFAELVKRRVGLVYSVALRQVGGDAHLAQDVAQRVFTDLARKAAALAGRPVLSGWLYRSAQFAASDVVRSERRRRVREQENLIMNATVGPGGSDSAVDWDKLRPVLDEAMAELGDEDRDAVALRFLEEKPFAEIGRRLAISEEAARKRVSRALEKLHAGLAQRGITSTTAALALALGNQAAAAVPAGIAASVTGAALAGVANTGGAAAFLTFMSTTKVVSGIAGAVTLLAVFSALRDSGRVREATATIVSISAERDELKERLGALSRERNDIGDAGSDATTGGPKPSTPRVASLSMPAHSHDAAYRSAAWGLTSPVNLALEHPEARAAFVQQEVLRAMARFGHFFKSTGISSEVQGEIGKHFNAYAEAMLDYYSAVRAQGFGPMNPPQDPNVLVELLRMENDVVARFTDDLRVVLGDERTKQFIEYQKSVPEINVADQLAAQLYATDVPLTGPQALQLVQLLKDSRHDGDTKPSPTNTMNGTFVSSESLGAAVQFSNLVTGSLMMPGRLTWAAPITDAAIARAQTILAPTQLQALRQLQAQQVAQYQLAPPTPKGATPEQALQIVRKQGAK